jgi:hypothetical protein
MTDVQVKSPTPSAIMLTGERENDRPAAAGLAVWLSVQLAAIGISAARVTLWARAPQATEQLALVLTLATQIGASALIFPHLLGTRGATALAIASGWPMALLAAQLADAPFSILIRGELYVSIWLISLHLWTRALPSPSAKLLATAIAAMISLGAPVLCYLRMEFSNDFSQSASDPLPAFGPISGVISQNFPRFRFESWIELTIIFCTGAIAFKGATSIPRWFRFSRQVIH